MLKEYGNGLDGGDKLYFIDSNVLLAICQFYYRGKSNAGGISTEEIKQFILRARPYGVQNQFAITEWCFDYNKNAINAEQMQKIMIAFDNLIVNMSEEEISNYNKMLDIDARRSENRNVQMYHSIFDCKLIDYIFSDWKDNMNLFYGIYLYILKIYSLYNNKILSPMEKIRELFSFMLNEIDIFMSFEFYMGCMTFVGTNEEKDIAKGILKPKQKPELYDILNSVIDLFQYRMVCYISDLCIKNKELQKIFFVTADKALQRYIECNIEYSSVILPNKIFPFGNFKMNINKGCINDFHDFYTKDYLPELEKRFKTRSTREENNLQTLSNIIYSNIIKLEKEVFT